MKAGRESTCNDRPSCAPPPVQGGYTFELRRSPRRFKGKSFSHGGAMIIPPALVVYFASQRRQATVAKIFCLPSLDGVWTIW